MTLSENIDIDIDNVILENIDTDIEHPYPQEKKLEKYVDSSEIFKIFFGGRYIIFMMSVGAIYTGLIYNDIFSKSFNIFGSHFKVLYYLIYLILSM